MCAYLTGNLPFAARLHGQRGGGIAHYLDLPQKAVPAMMTTLAGDVAARWWEWGSFDWRKEITVWAAATVGTRWFSPDDLCKMTPDMQEVLTVLHANRTLLNVGFAGPNPHRELVGQFVGRLVDICRGMLIPYEPCIDRLGRMLDRMDHLTARDILPIIRDFKPKSVPYALNLGEVARLEADASRWIDDGVAGRLRLSDVGGSLEPLLPGSRREHVAQDRGPRRKEYGRGCSPAERVTLKSEVKSHGQTKGIRSADVRNLPVVAVAGGRR